MKRTYAYALVAMIACGGHAETAPKSVTVEPQPLPSASVAPVVAPHKVDGASLFVAAGCTKGANGALDCTNAKIPGIEKCRPALHLLDVSFDPPAAVAECFVQDGKGLRDVGCMLRSAVQLVVATGSGFVVIDSVGGLAKTFAPVTSKEEAIAFAVATTGGIWVESSSPGPYGPSHVREAADGHHVELFFHQVCGCHHPTTAVEYLVLRSGAVKELSRTDVGEDMRGLCVD